MQLNRLTDYAVVMMSQMARHRGAVVPAMSVTEATGVPLPTVQKVLKNLVRAGLIESHRGVGGGYSMNLAPTGVTVGDIVAAIEGPIMLTACVDGSEAPCTAASLCPLAGNWNRVNDEIRSAFESVTLTDMMTYTPASPARRVAEPVS